MFSSWSCAQPVAWNEAVSLGRDAYSLEAELTNGGVFSVDIFGSVAAGASSAESDLDIIVGGASADSAFHAQYVLQNFTGGEVDAISELALVAVEARWEFDAVQKQVIRIPLLREGAAQPVGLSLLGQQRGLKQTYTVISDEPDRPSPHEEAIASSVSLMTEQFSALLRDTQSRRVELVSRMRCETGKGCERAVGEVTGVLVRRAQRDDVVDLLSDEGFAIPAIGFMSSMSKTSLRLSGATEAVAIADAFDEPLTFSELAWEVLDWESEFLTPHDDARQHLDRICSGLVSRTV